jgi:hypothetical protein
VVVIPPGLDSESVTVLSLEPDLGFDPDILIPLSFYCNPI